MQKCLEILIKVLKRLLLKVEAECDSFLHSVKRRLHGRLLADNRRFETLSVFESCSYDDFGAQSKRALRRT